MSRCQTVTGIDARQPWRPRKLVELALVLLPVATAAILVGPPNSDEPSVARLTLFVAGMLASIDALLLLAIALVRRRRAAPAAVVSEPVQRLRVSPLLLLSLAMCVGLGLGIEFHDDHVRHEQSKAASSFKTAAADLARMQLPAGLRLRTQGTRFCQPSQGVLCATSRLQPSTVYPLAARFIHAPRAGNAATPAEGKIDGVLTFSIVTPVFRHVPTDPPAWAKPVGPRRFHNYSVGSVVTIQIDQPGQTGS